MDAIVNGDLKADQGVEVQLRQVRGQIEDLDESLTRLQFAVGDIPHDRGEKRPVAIPRGGHCSFLGGWHHTGRGDSFNAFVKERNKRPYHHQKVITRDGIEMRKLTRLQTLVETKKLTRYKLMID